MYRLERIVYKLAAQHAPHLIPSDWGEDAEPVERVARLARWLAADGVLVLVGEVPADARPEAQLHVGQWVEPYMRLHGLLVNALFPSFKKVDARYADDPDNNPVAVVLEGEATAVLAAFAGYVTPYVAARQSQGDASDVELYGVMNLLLEALEAGDLPRAAYDELRETGKGILRHLLHTTVRHISLTDFDSNMFNLNVNVEGASHEQAPQDEPHAPSESNPPPDEAVPPPPTDLPEEGQFTLDHLAEDDSETTPTEQLFVNPVPLSRSALGRKPPIPPLPDDDEPAAADKGGRDNGVR